MKTLSLLLMAILLNICYAQTVSSKVVNLISYLSKGETLNYSVVKTRIDSSNTKEPKTEEHNFNFKITVQDSTDTSYRITYYRTIDIISNPQLKEVPDNLKNSLQRMSTIKIDYETDELGSFKHIINENLLVEKINSDMNELSTAFKSFNSNENIDKFMNDFMGSIDPKSLIGIYTQDIQALHTALGGSFSTQDTIEFEDEVIAPILNFPIKMKGILYCDEYDEENDFFSLTEEKYVEGNFMDKVFEFFKKYENKDKPIPEEEFKNMKMDIYFHNTYQYNSLYGVATYIELFKEITVNNKEENMKRIDIYEISLMEE